MSARPIGTWKLLGFAMLYATVVIGVVLVASISTSSVKNGAPSESPTTMSASEDADARRMETTMGGGAAHVVHTIRLEPGVRLESVTWQCPLADLRLCRPWVVTRPLLPGESPRTLTLRTPVSDVRLNDKTYVFVESL